MKNVSDAFSSASIRKFVDAGYYRYRAGYAWQRSCMHSSLYFIAEGTMHFSFSGRKITVRQNDIVFVRAEEIALLESDKSQAAALYYIAFHADDAFFADRIAEVTHSPDAAALFRSVVDDYNSGAPLCEFKIASALYQILYLLASERLQASPEYQQYAQIRRAGEYINKNYYKTITEEELCAVAGYSSAHLRRLFPKVYGCSPKAYILKTKLARAKRILAEEPNKTVEEISELLGFCSPTYFSSVFRKKSGMSPCEYREASRRK